MYVLTINHLNIKEFLEKKSCIHTNSHNPFHTWTQIKPKVFRVKSGILIKYKNQMDP